MAGVFIRPLAAKPTTWHTTVTGGGDCMREGGLIYTGLDATVPLTTTSRWLTPIPAADSRCHLLLTSGTHCVWSRLRS